MKQRRKDAVIMISICIAVNLDTGPLFVLINAKNSTLQTSILSVSLAPPTNRIFFTP